MKKLVCLLFSILMCIALTAPAFAIDAGGVDGDPNGTTNDDQLNVYVNKYLNGDSECYTTELGADKKVDITLQLAGDEKQLDSAVVFCFDYSFSVENREKTVFAAVQELYNHVKNTNASVKVGLVVFNKDAHALMGGKLVELSSDTLNTIEEALKESPSSGSNMHAGLVAAKKMLDEATDIPANRKHMVLITDGRTYLFDNGGITSTIYSEQGTLSEHNSAEEIKRGDIKRNIMGGLSAGEMKYGENSKNLATMTFGSKTGVCKEYFDNLEKSGISNMSAYYLPYEGYVIEEQGGIALKYGGTYLYKGIDEDRYVNFDKYIPYENKDTAINTIDVALYLANKEYQAMKDAGYDCYVYNKLEGLNESYPWGTQFIEYLQQGQSATAFNDIKNDIIYMLGSGSKVVDKMGPYFDLDFDSLLMVKTVDGNEQLIDGVKIEDEDNRYGFGAINSDGRYEHEAVYNEESDELTWYINTNVSRYQPVRLMYTATMTMSDDDFAKENRYDTITQLLTNEYAILEPVSFNTSNNEPRPGRKVNFPEPTVWYQVKKGTTPEEKPGEDKPNNNGGGGSSTITPKPVVNTAVK